jgi:ABC-type transport system involved in cytochrome bd biosynthesis fused ATPase/permease subunit
LIRQAFLLLPITVAVMPQYINAFNRVQTFIAQPDIVPVEKSQAAGTEIILENASFTWPTATEPVLKNINMTVRILYLF